MKIAARVGNMTVFGSKSVIYPTLADDLIAGEQSPQFRGIDGATNEQGAIWRRALSDDICPIARLAPTMSVRAATLSL
jgi:hypothetical protein